MKNIELVNYSEKAIVLIGDTKKYKSELKKLGGRFNPNLKCGAGWIFSLKKKSEIEKFLELNLVKEQKEQNNWLYDLALKDSVKSKHISKYIREGANKRGVKVKVKTSNSILVEILENNENNKDFVNFCSNLSGKGFDGSIDMAYYYRHAVNKAGEIISLGSTGTYDSRGFVPDTLKEMPEGAINLSIYCYIILTNKNEILA
jgi:hypothetical protein